MKESFRSSTGDADLGRCDTLVDRTASLPGRVLRSPLQAAGFMELDLAVDWGWGLYSRLCALAGDDAVIVITVRPDPHEYYLANFQELPVLRIPPCTPEPQYLEALDSIPAAGSPDSMKTRSDELIWFSDSGRWLVWGDHENELAVVAATPEFFPAFESAVRQHRPERYRLRVLPAREAVKTWVYQPRPGLIDALEASYPEATGSWESLPPATS